MMYENIDFNSIDLTQEPPVSEPERQYYFIAKCRQYVKEQEELAGHPLTADVVWLPDECPRLRKAFRHSGTGRLHLKRQ